MTALEILGWVAWALNMWGNLLLTSVSNRGHVVRLCSNACWLLYAPSVGAWALFANHCTFAVINVVGYARWHRAAREGRISDGRNRCPGCRELAPRGWEGLWLCERCTNTWLTARVRGRA